MIRRRSVRIPRSSERNSSYAFAKLLARVERNRRVGGFSAFIGSLIRPGKLIEEDALWPSTEYPANPILLECAGPVSGSGRGHNRAPFLWLLWRYDRQSGEWQELCRATAHDWTWSVDLFPIAERALTQGQAEPAAPDLCAIAERIAATMDSELKPLDLGDKARVLSAVEHSVAARIVGLEGC